MNLLEILTNRFTKKKLVDTGTNRESWDQAIILARGGCIGNFPLKEDSSVFVLTDEASIRIEQKRASISRGYIYV